MSEVMTLRDQQTAATRERILAATAAVLARGDEPTFAAIAHEVGCRERTVYRHFASKDDLARAFWDWQYAVFGRPDRSATGAAELHAQTAAAFAAFDARPELVRAMLHTRHGRAARLSDNAARQQAMLRTAAAELPQLDPPTRRRAAAAIQLLSSAAAWEVLRDYWDMTADEAAATARLAITAILDGLDARRGPRRKKDPP
jgi:AcrR family transcriptional regulator